LGSKRDAATRISRDSPNACHAKPLDTGHGTDDPTSERSRYTYLWFQHGVHGFIDGADREPLEGFAHSAHKVANKDGSLGSLVLAETDDTAPFVQVFADLDVVDEIDIGGRRVTLLEGTSDGIDGSVFLFSESGISGSLATNAVDMAAARRFLEALLAA
jgi:hypothetical protein